MAEQATHDLQSGPAHEASGPRGAPMRFHRFSLAALMAVALALPGMAQADTSDQRRDERQRSVYTVSQFSIPEVDEDPSEFSGATRPANWVQSVVASVVSLVTGTPSSTSRPSSELRSAFSELDDYQDIYRLAAGWNGDRFFQYRLGLMFESGNGAVSINLPASYYFYSLSAAQNFQEAIDNRRELLLGNLPRRDIVIDDLNEVYLKFVETYVFGGTEAQFRLGEHLEGDFFNNDLHNQDAIDRDKNFPGRRLIHALAAYMLAESGGHPDAERKRLALIDRRDLGQYDEEAAEQVAREWARMLGIGNVENPFQLSENLTEKALSRGSDFQDRRSETLSKRDDARSWLLSGRSFQARGDIKRAKIAYETAIGSATSSRAALEAQQALQSLTTTCSAAPRNHSENPLGQVWKINLEAQQFALRSLGHYEGSIDGDPGPMTRAGIRSFLSSLNVDVKDFLDAEQVVELICSAAQLRGHAPSQNMLGLMYANGIGVVRDDELAHYWFSQAAQQRFASGILNVAKMYADERGLPMKGHPQNCAIARSYMTEARDLGHPEARRELAKLKQAPACRRYGARSG